MRSCRRPTARSSRKRVSTAATRRRTSTGSPTRKALLGKASVRLEPCRFTAPRIASSRRAVAATRRAVAAARMLRRVQEPKRVVVRLLRELGAQTKAAALGALALELAPRCALGRADLAL